MTSQQYGNVTSQQYGNVTSQQYGNVTDQQYGNVTDQQYENVTGQQYENVTGQQYEAELPPEYENLTSSSIPVQEPVYGNTSISKTPPIGEGFVPPTSPVPTIDIQYRATFQYTATNDSEISFNQGDILVSCSDNAQDGWIKVEKEGHRGWAPIDYLQPLGKYMSTCTYTCTCTCTCTFINYIINYYR